ncbi:alpha/beta fold hydrolase [Microbacterium sp. P04]|uniref:alpha/beta fold hydrolase n=1 Tax=Microbacterium sp. P04 TaxID=3366947 RepID=UPI003745D771
MARREKYENVVEHRIDLDDRVFRVLSTDTAGAAAGSPYVLIHGIGMSHRYFTRLHDELAADAPVHSIDLPGFGGLPKPGRDLDVTEMATSLAEVIDRVIGEPVVLVGHSMGAQWVVELAALRPDLVLGVVAMGPVSDDRHRTVMAQARALALDSLGEPPRANAIVFGDYLRCGVRWYLTQVRHMVSYPIEDRVAQLRAPLLVLRGGSDPIAGVDWCRRLRDRALDAAFVTVPRGFHVVQWSAPRAVASAIAAFVSGRVEAPTP